MFHKTPGWRYHIAKISSTPEIAFAMFQKRAISQIEVPAPLMNNPPTLNRAHSNECKGTFLKSSASSTKKSFRFFKSRRSEEEKHTALHLHVLSSQGLQVSPHESQIHRRLSLPPPLSAPSPKWMF
ncbi:hypothetical protein CDAR_188001 [Caerostris darwini]|uniref:Uncharacterized protein n=1 Tax=Caerostris darwini TaxID=1538125 RepID=A0AAV4SQR0_9ARAC|nr:hypothetical protein CDAR_188001 [Caerostris darwini]